MNGSSPRMNSQQPPSKMVPKAQGDAPWSPCGKRGMPMDDQQLLAALVGINRDTALAECIRRFGPMVRRTAWRITCDEHRADDVCQAVFLILLRKAAGLANHTSPSAWLHQVTVLTARDMVKSEARRQRREQEAVMVAQAQATPLTRLPTGIDQAIVRLPEIYRRVIVAYYLEGHSHAAVAAKLGVSEEIVRKRASRGLDRLRKYLARTAVGSLTVAALTGLLTGEAAAAQTTCLTAAQVAAIQAAAAGSASVQVSGLATAATKALVWAKVKVYAAIVASVAVVAVPAVVMLKPADTGLVGHYLFDEGKGAQLFDASHSGNHGTLVGGVTWTPGPKPGSKALSFDGKTGYIKLDKDLSQWLGGTATVTFWIKTTQTGAEMWNSPTVIGVRVPGINDVKWGFIDKTGRIGGGGGGAPDTGPVSTTPINDGGWHHVALTRDAATGKVQIFLEGVLNQSDISGAGIKTPPLQYIGRMDTETPKEVYFFSGSLRDLRCFNRVLAAAEIRKLAE
jgi:RNA polymerase sigma factor (sigma-70 family)